MQHAVVLEFVLTTLAQTASSGKQTATQASAGEAGAETAAEEEDTGADGIVLCLFALRQYAALIAASPFRVGVVKQLRETYKFAFQHVLTILQVRGLRFLCARACMYVCGC